MDVDEAVSRAARYALERCRDHDWHSLAERGAALRGLLAAGCGSDVGELIDHAVATQTSGGNLAADFVGAQTWDDVLSGWTGASGYTSNIGSPMIGQSVLEWYDRTGDTSYLDAARRQYEALRSLDRTTDGGIPTRRERSELWIDAVDMFAPFLARYGRCDDEPAALDDAVLQIEVHADHLFSPRAGLYRHIWSEQPDHFPESSFWARGNGWMFTGLADTLRFLPTDHEGRPGLERRFTDHAEVLADCRDGSGLWRNVLDDPEAPLEVSASCMFAHGFAAGVQMDLLPAEYRDLATETVEAAAGFVSTEGAVRRVALTPGGPDAPIGGAGQGQAWFLIAADSVTAV
jgi:unsaturated rhamnogalacturonyl hydrolase